MPTITIREALNQAIREELARDERVFIMGEEVAEYDGAYKVTRGLLNESGPERVIDSPRPELRRGDGRTAADRRVHDVQLFDSRH